MAQSDNRNLPVLVPVADPAGASTQNRTAPGGACKAAAYSPLDAHMVLQAGRRRGLKAGPDAIREARRAYLQAQYAGPDDRRPETGLVRAVKL